MPQNINKHANFALEPLISYDKHVVKGYLMPMTGK